MSKTKLYFHWLCGQIAIPQDESRWDLLSEIHNKQFVWSVLNDDNREADAFELRNEFFREKGREAADSSVVSVLEVIVALSRRISFDYDGAPEDWAWQLIKNLELDKDRFLDPLYPEEVEQISDVLDKLIWRQYDPNGQGGFFPLGFPQENQTQVEIWYQMAAYFEERHPEHGT